MRQNIVDCTITLQQSTILREGLHGFIFESNRGTRVNITTENPLGPQFQFNWNKQDGRKFQTKAEALQLKVKHLAQDLQSKYFTASQESTRKVAAELRAILSSVEESCQAHDKEEVSGNTSLVHEESVSECVWLSLRRWSLV